jgi:hypothetical protein
MGLARRAQGARRRRCRCASSTTSNAAIVVQPPCALRVPGLEGASASLALLDDVHRYRLRRAALHLPLPSQERGPFQFSDRLLGLPAEENSSLQILHT